MSETKPLEEFDKKIINQFNREVVRKSYAQTLTFLSDFPVYVAEFFISQYADQNGYLANDAIKIIEDKIKNHKPGKYQKERVKRDLKEMGYIDLIDKFSVYTDLNHGKYITQVDILDERSTVNPDLILPHSFEKLLEGGMWGKATFQYVQAGELARINMNDFEPYQSKFALLSRFIRNRKNFTSDEWIDLIIRSIGLDPRQFTRREKLLFIVRLIPAVEKSTNSLEFGPPGTGKSYQYENLSQYTRMLMGGNVSLAKLIYNKSTKRPGYVFYQDLIVFDEINKASSNLKQIVPTLQQIMASNRAERGDMEAITPVSLVFQGNPIKGRGAANFDYSESLKALPNQFYDIAFLDRIHRYIHGWDFPRYSPRMQNKGIGLISNYFGEVLHKLRNENFDSLIQNQVKLLAKDPDGNIIPISARDVQAVKTSLSGLLKILYPDKKISAEELAELVELAIELRQNVIKEMAAIDSIYNISLEYQLLNSQTSSVSKMQKSDPSLQPIASETTISSKELITKKAQEKSAIHKAPQTVKKPDLQKLPLNERTPLLIFPEIVLTPNYQFTRPLPYYMVKILVDEKGIKKTSTELLFNKEKLTYFKNSFKIRQVKENPISYSEMSHQNPVYAEEEKAQKGEILNIQRIKQVLDNYSSKIRDLKQYRHLVYSNFQQDPKEFEELLDEIEKFLDVDCKYKKYQLAEISDQIEYALDEIREAAGKEPNLLHDFYKDLIISESDRLKQLEELYKAWHREYKNLDKASTKLIKKILDMGISLRDFETPKHLDPINLPIQSKTDKIPIFAFDWNNIHNSVKKKYQLSNRPSEFLLKKLNTEILTKKPYFAFFFASQFLSSYKKHIPEGKYHKWYFEEKMKGSIAADVDTLLSTNMTAFLYEYSKNISKFYICSGDKDFCPLVEKIKKFNIPTHIIAYNSSSISREIREISDDVSFFEN